MRWVPNAEAGAAEIEHDGIDLVFSDIVMPGRLDGLGLARSIKEKRPELPILLATGYSEAAQNVPRIFRSCASPTRCTSSAARSPKCCPARIDAPPASRRRKQKARRNGRAFHS